MSTVRPITRGRPRELNTVVLLRNAFVALNDLVVVELAAAGHGAVRAAHGVVFQHLDETGTTVSALADRAQMTKQAMAELVQHLEQHGYVTRVPDPNDRRAKLVLPTERGREVVDVAQRLVPSIESRLADLLGAERTEQLRGDLQAIREATRSGSLASGQ